MKAELPVPEVDDDVTGLMAVAQAVTGIAVGGAGDGGLAALRYVAARHVVRIEVQTERVNGLPVAQWHVIVEGAGDFVAPTLLLAVLLALRSVAG